MESCIHQMRKALYQVQRDETTIVERFERLAHERYYRGLLAKSRRYEGFTQNRKDAA